MPELPEVETIRRGLEAAILDKKVKSIRINRSDLRVAVPPDFCIVIESQKIVATLRRGKYILAFTEEGPGFVLHLGMSGRIKIFNPGKTYEPDIHDHVIFEMNDDMRVVYSDPRRFGMLYLTHRDTWQNDKAFTGMGPEPLEPSFAGPVLYKALQRRGGPIKTVLLDQRVVAGIGNIYACEALFFAGISPFRPADEISKREAGKLAAALKDVLERALAAGGSSLRDYRHTDGSLGYFQHGFSVYDRKGQVCPGCTCNTDKTGGIQKVAQAARSTYYCPRKQK